MVSGNNDLSEQRYDNRLESVRTEDWLAIGMETFLMLKVKIRAIKEEEATRDIR